MARKCEYKKAKTCIHAIQLTQYGGLFVKESCVMENKLQLPCPTITGRTVKRPYTMAKYCNSCKGYEKAAIKALKLKKVKPVIRKFVKAK